MRRAAAQSRTKRLRLRLAIDRQLRFGIRYAATLLALGIGALSAADAVKRLASRGDYGDVFGLCSGRAVGARRRSSSA